MLATQQNIARLVASLGLVAGISGCEVGEVDPGGSGGTGGVGDDPARIESGDPDVDQRLDDLGIVCESILEVTGTFVEGDPRPPEENGCWAVGTWTLQATVNFQGCDPQEDLAAEYVYEVTKDDESNTNIVFLADPDSERLNLKITTAGDGLCHASFEHFGEDRRVITLQPTMDVAGTIQGEGAFSVWDEDPF